MYENRTFARLEGQGGGGEECHDPLHSRAAKVEAPSMASRCRSKMGILSAPLLVAAEGRNSPTARRRGSGCALEICHAAMCRRCATHCSPPGRARDFYPAAVALLPMMTMRRRPPLGIVWSVGAAGLPSLLSLSDAIRRGGASGDGWFLGHVDMIAPRSSWPRAFTMRARSLRRLALVGDAATGGIRLPAGRQPWLSRRRGAGAGSGRGCGLGLDWEPGNCSIAIKQWRGLDTFMVAVATDTSARIYGVPGKTASRFRRFGMGLIDSIGPARIA